MGLISGLLGGLGVPTTGLIGQIGNGLSNNSNMLLGLATGGGQGAVQGARLDALNALEQKQEDEKKQKLAAAMKLAESQHLPPEFAQAFPDQVGAIAAKKYMPREPSFEERLFGMIPEDQRSSAAMAKFGLGSPKPTDDLREYQAAVQQGYKGSFMDYQTELKRAGATNVNVGGERSYDQTVGKGYADTFLSSQDAGRKAPVTIGTLDTMEKLMDTPGFYSGTNSDLNLKFKQGIAALGGDPKAPASMETFRSLANQNVLSSIGSLGTGVSEGDRQFVTQSAAGLGNTPQGNKQMIAIARALEQRKQEVAQFARQYASQHGGRLDQGFDEALAQWAEQNPIRDKFASAGGLGVGQETTINGVTVKRVK